MSDRKLSILTDSEMESIRHVMEHQGFADALVLTWAHVLEKHGESWDDYDEHNRIPVSQYAIPEHQADRILRWALDAPGGASAALTWVNVGPGSEKVAA